MQERGQVVALENVESTLTRTFLIFSRKQSGIYENKSLCSKTVARFLDLDKIETSNPM